MTEEFEPKTDPNRSTTQPDLRTRCRQCRGKLPGDEPVEERRAFCCRTCSEIYHRRHCAVCGKAMPRKAKGSPIQLCSRACRKVARGLPKVIPGHPTGNRISSARNPCGTGTESAHFCDRR